MEALGGSFLLKTHVLLDLQEIWLMLLFQYLQFCFLYSYSEKNLLYHLLGRTSFASIIYLISFSSLFLYIRTILPFNHSKLLSLKLFFLPIITCFLVFPPYFLVCLCIYVHMCAEECVCMRVILPMCACLHKGQKSTSDVRNHLSALFIPCHCSLAWNLQTQLGWTTRACKGSTLLCSLITGIPITCPHACFFHMSWALNSDPHA